MICVLSLQSKNARPPVRFDMWLPSGDVLKPRCLTPILLACNRLGLTLWVLWSSEMQLAASLASTCQRLLHLTTRQLLRWLLTLARAWRPLR